MTKAADHAYANADFIPGGMEYPAMWAQKAAGFRAASPLKSLDIPYGSTPGQWFDLFEPGGPAKGTVVFVHGGYWLRFGPKDFSHLAAGAVAAGYACAMPSYRLAPSARISDITGDIARALGAIAARTSGPLVLAGHSAGGHLVARMGCPDMAADWTPRVARIMPISPLSNLEPLMETSMNAQLAIDGPEAVRESPVTYDAPGCPVTVVVGTAERPAFLDQAQWLADRWQAEQLLEEGKHHFNVIEGLEHPDSPMMRALLAPL